MQNFCLYWSIVLILFSKNVALPAIHDNLQQTHAIKMLFFMIDPVQKNIHKKVESTLLISAMVWTCFWIIYFYIAHMLGKIHKENRTYHRSTFKAVNNFRSDKKDRKSAIRHQNILHTSKVLINLLISKINLYWSFN